jgi:predicted amidohydrolase
MAVRVGDVEANLATATTMIGEAARRGSDLIVLPELWASGYDLAHAAQHAGGLDSGMAAHVAGLAREHRIAICSSLLTRLEGGGVGNTAVYVDANGQTLAAYSKVHLFGPMGEQRYLAEGEQLALVATGWGTAGLAICYDLRFPELFRAYALAGADAVILPAQWPRPRLEHWRTLLRARAIENQMLVIACNRVGRDGETEFFGRSAIIDACGETVIEGGGQEDLLTATVDMAHVQQVRESMPVFDDRRPVVYKSLA